jgi:hypothetical protein
MSGITDHLADSPLPDADPALIRQMFHLMKVGAELGEAFDAFEGMTGSNLRKGVYATPDDLKKELGDVILAALVPLTGLCGGVQQAMDFLTDYAASRNARLAAALRAA